MDKDSYLKKIHRNLKISTRNLNDRWGKIFFGYLMKLHMSKSQVAEQYLALHMGELDAEFQLYYLHYAKFLEEKGLSDAAKFMKRMGEDFSIGFRNYRVERSPDIAKNAELVAKCLAKNIKIKKNKEVKTNGR